MNEKVNVRTIAKAVDLSPITVSRALNGHPGVKATTRNRVLKKVGELGYNYKVSSTTVRNDRARRVALHCVEEKLHGDIYFNFYSQLYFNFINKLKKLGYTGYTIDLGKNCDENAETLDKCGSLILLSEVPHKEMEKLKKNNTHLNIISVFADEPDFHMVRPDDVRGGELAADYLLKKNHKHVAIFTEFGEPCFRLRYSGFTGQMIYKAPDSRVDLIRFVNDFDKNKADSEKLKALDEYFDNAEKLPDSIFAANGYSAVFLYNYLKKRGISVPDDIGIIGYDNFDYYQLLDIPLSRIFFDLKTLAGQGVELLDNVVKRNVKGVFNILTPVKLVDKKSVKEL